MEHVESARRTRSLLVEGRSKPTEFLAAVNSVAPVARDGWFDLVLGLDDVPDDGPDLPAGCVPYLPCGVPTLLRMLHDANVSARDIFVDVGSGVGRAAAFAHFVTGAPVIGIEIQSELARASRALAKTFNLERVKVIEGDAVELTGYIMIGTVFFLYCPFSGARLERVVDDLEAIARTREIRVCCVDVVLPHRDWLARSSSTASEVAVYRSTFFDAP